MNDIDDNILENVDNPLKDLSASKEITLQQILNNLLDGSKNLDLKTHIAKPKKLASLLTLSKYLKSIGYTKSAKVIVDFIDTYLRYMVSYDRLSRIETIRALTPIDHLKEYIDNKFSSID